MLLCGIDEAGYGPLLGPLVVCGAAFRLPEAPGEGGHAELRRRLRGAIAGPGRAARGRLVVGDSKQVFGGTRDLAALEHPVLGFLGAASGERACEERAGLDGLLRAVGVDPAERRARPWYAGDPGRWPLRAEAAGVAADAERLAGRLAAAGVEFVGLAADVVPEDRLNREIAHRGNKADALFAASAGVLERLLARRLAGETVHVVLDRQGGRRRYHPLLAMRWPERMVWALGEEPRRSSYRVSLGDADAVLEFLVDGDRHALAVGLASMAAKYLREVHMALWNAWFAERCPGIGPTAGYSQDGRRWLEESRPSRAAAGVPDDLLVRVR